MTGRERRCFMVTVLALLGVVLAATATSAATSMATSTPTRTPKGQPQPSATSTSTGQPPPVGTASSTPTEVDQPAGTPTSTPTEGGPQVGTATSTPTGVEPQVGTATHTPTHTPTSTATSTLTHTATSTATSTPDGDEERRTDEEPTNIPTPTPTTTSTPTQGTPQATITATAQAGPDEQFFPETGQWVPNPFIEFWRRNGGLPVFGFPITPDQPEPNPDTGDTHLVQWFERYRFELHPELRPPYNILLGRLGHERLQQIGVDWRSLPRDAGPQPGCRWFPETRRNVCDQLPEVGFKSYWETHGLQDPRDVRGEVRQFQDAPLDAYRRSLALFGLPLTPARIETNTSGDTVLTQWFERARFEWHPTNPPGFQVLVGRLGWEVRNNLPVPGPGGPAPTPTRPSGNIECDEIVQISPGLFQCRARFADADHDPYAILITGRSRANVARFADEMILSLNSTMIDAAPLTQGNGGTEESIADAVLAENPENLVIDIAPLRPVSGAFQIEIIIDPYIEQGHKHLYRQRCGTSVRAQVSVYPGGGSVEAALLRGRARQGPVRIGPETPLRLDPSPPSTYEVQITGLGPGSNNYRVSGTWTRVESGGSRSNQRC